MAIEPTPYQAKVLAVPELFNIALLGGRGGGKTTALILLVLRHCVKYEARAKPLIVRETYKALERIEDELETLFASAFPHGGVNHNRAEHIFRLPNRAQVELAQIDSLRAYNKHQGRECTMLAIDELPNFRTDRYVNLLRANLRGPEGLPLRMVITGNPGGPLHGQVARRHVDGRIPWRPYELGEYGDKWVTCPSVYTDNPHIVHEDYARQIQAAAGNDRVLAEAWLSNRWDQIRGAFFADVWGDHLFLPDDDNWRVPHGPVSETGWQSFVALDWGWSAPSVALLIARPIGGGLPGPAGRNYPAKSCIVIDELATARADDPNEGLGWPPQMLAEEILTLCEGRGVRPIGVGDDARGIQNDTLLETLRQYGLDLDKPIKDRVSGWVNVTQMMANARDGERRGLWINERCRYLMETMPSLPRNELRPEDVDTTAADHGADALRYGCAHVPFRVTYGRTVGAR